MVSVSHVTIARLQNQAALDFPLPRPRRLPILTDPDKSKIVRDNYITILFRTLTSMVEEISCSGCIICLELTRPVKWMVVLSVRYAVKLCRTFHWGQPSITDWTVNTSFFNSIPTRNILQDRHGNKVCKSLRETSSPHGETSTFSEFISDRAPLVCSQDRPSSMFGSSIRHFQSLKKIQD